MESVVLECEKREKCSSRYSRMLRRQGKVPGIIYGQDREPVAVTFNEKKVTKIVHHERAVITVRLDAKDIKGIIRDVHYDPVTENVLHVDIMGIDITRKVRLMVPVVLQGTPAAIKTGGILEHVSREIEVECLPMDIPEHISVDVSSLEVGDAIHASDIVLEKVKILERPDAVIAAAVAPKVEKVAVAAEEAAAAEVPAEGAEKAEKEGEKKEE